MFLNEDDNTNVKERLQLDEGKQPYHCDSKRATTSETYVGNRKIGIYKEIYKNTTTFRRNKQRTALP